MRHFSLFPLPPRRMRYRRLTWWVAPFPLHRMEQRVVKALAYTLLALIVCILVELLTGCACQPTLALNPDRAGTVECVGLDCHWEF